MPEGPEIRLAADRIGKVLVNKHIVDVYFAFPRLRKIAQKLKGSTVTAVDTHGKAMLTRFDAGLTLYSHNQLYGVWYTVPRDRPPKTERSLRVALHTSTHSALLYSASDIELLTQQQVVSHPFLTRLGPDILNEHLTASDIVKRLDDVRFRSRAVGALYLDQSFMAGVGNYLRSEILYVAGVHHIDKPKLLDKNTINRLARATLRVSQRSYRTGGITITQKIARSLHSRGLSYQQRRFWVYRREGLPCYGCGTPIIKTSVSNRPLFFCPACQVPSLGHAKDSRPDTNGKNEMHRDEQLGVRSVARRLKSI